MISYSKRLGESMFDKLFPTTPGRVDPRTGMLVATSQISIPELQRMAKDRESRGRGYEGPSRGYEDRGRGEEGSFFREGSAPRGRGEYEGLRRQGMSGFGEQTSILQNPALWLILGTGILISLEVSGITHFSPKA